MYKARWAARQLCYYTHDLPPSLACSAAGFGLVRVPSCTVLIEFVLARLHDDWQCSRYTWLTLMCILDACGPELLINIILGSDRKRREGGEGTGGEDGGGGGGEVRASGGEGEEGEKTVKRENRREGRG